jgi:hypothetical protein
VVARLRRVVRLGGRPPPAGGGGWFPALDSEAAVKALSRLGQVRDLGGLLGVTPP